MDTTSSASVPTITVSRSDAVKAIGHEPPISEAAYGAANRCPKGAASLWHRAVRPVAGGSESALLTRSHYTGRAAESNLFAAISHFRVTVVQAPRSVRYHAPSVQRTCRPKRWRYGHCR